MKTEVITDLVVNPSKGITQERTNVVLYDLYTDPSALKTLELDGDVIKIQTKFMDEAQPIGIIPHLEEDVWRHHLKLFSWRVTGTERLEEDTFHNLKYDLKLNILLTFKVL